MLDQYQTITATSQGLYKEKGSKFIAIAFPIFSEDEFKEQLQQVKKDYHDARHHCYAFKIGLTQNEYRYSDDGEPNNSAGSPIYGQIKSFELTNIGIVVVRYFGGTKLGVGGLITAYKEAAKDAINNAQIITRTVDNFYEIQFGYEILSDVMNFIKKKELEVTSQLLEDHGTIQFKIRQKKAEETIEKFEKISGIKIQLIKSI